MPQHSVFNAEPRGRRVVVPLWPAQHEPRHLSQVCCTIPSVPWRSAALDVRCGANGRVQRTARAKVWTLRRASISASTLAVFEACQRNVHVCTPEREQHAVPSTTAPNLSRCLAGCRFPPRPRAPRYRRGRCFAAAGSGLCAIHHERLGAVALAMTVDCANLGRRRRRSREPTGCGRWAHASTLVPFKGVVARGLAGGACPSSALLPEPHFSAVSDTRRWPASALLRSRVAPRKHVASVSRRALLAAAPRANWRERPCLGSGALLRRALVVCVGFRCSLQANSTGLSCVNTWDTL